MPLTCLDYPGECTKLKPNQREGRTHMAYVGRHYDIIWRSTIPKGFQFPIFLTTIGITTVYTFYES